MQVLLHMWNQYQFNVHVHRVTPYLFKKAFVLFMWLTGWTLKTYTYISIFSLLSLCFPAWEFFAVFFIRWFRMHTPSIKSETCFCWFQFFFHYKMQSIYIAYHSCTHLFVCTICLLPPPLLVESIKSQFAIALSIFFTQFHLISMWLI